MTRIQGLRLQWNFVIFEEVSSFLVQHHARYVNGHDYARENFIFPKNCDYIRGKKKISCSSENLR